MEGVVIRNAGEKDIPAMVDLLGTLFAIEEDFDIDPAIPASRGFRSCSTGAANTAASRWLK